jgi:hypothetical protein
VISARALALLALLISLPLAAQPRLPTPGELFDDPVVVGVLSAEGLVEDPVFGVAAPALGLARQVEMYQWRQTTGPDGQPAYDTVWASERIDSAGFDQPEGHANPGALPFGSQRWFAETARLDGRPVSPSSLWRELEGWQPLSPDPTALPLNLALLFVPDGIGLITSEDPDSPQVGDIRVRWAALPGGPVNAQVIEVDGGYRPASDAAGMDRLAALPDSLPGLEAGRGVLSNIWLWLGIALALALLIAPALLFRSRMTGKQ